jgi:shikimate kinase
MKMDAERSITTKSSGSAPETIFPEKIFLTGFSGSGKTSVAPLLAAYLGYRLCDIDSELELRQGASCTEMIQERGLPHFRTLERTLLLEISQDHSDRCVVALGGGAVTIPDIIPLLRENGLVLWLQIALPDILERLGSRDDRPLLQKKTEEDIAYFLDHRDSFYRAAAHLIVDVSGLDLQTTFQKILQSIIGYREGTLPPNLTDL